MIARSFVALSNLVHDYSDARDKRIVFYSVVFQNGRSIIVDFKAAVDVEPDSVTPIVERIVDVDIRSDFELPGPEVLRTFEFTLLPTSGKSWRNAANADEIHVEVRLIH